MLSLIAKASNSVLVMASAYQVILASVTQDSKVSTVVTQQIARTLETVVGTEFVCKKKAGILLAGRRFS